MFKTLLHGGVSAALALRPPRPPTVRLWDLRLTKSRLWTAMVAEQ